MKQRIIALLLALALTLSLCAVSALAEEQDQSQAGPETEETAGIATAEDTGSLILGHRIDLYYDTYDECVQFGARNCIVYILD